MIHDDYVDTLTSALLYLRDRGMLEATPEVKYLDVEEEREAEEKAAVVLQKQEQVRRKGNPYGA